MSLTSVQLAPKLSTASIKKSWDVYTAFDWPETLPEDNWYMSPELMSLYGTEYFDSLSEAQQKKLSFTELCNFFSLVLQGERPLVQGLAHRLYLKTTEPPVSDYLHHFIDEENKHMIMFGMFLNRYFGKVYPEKKVTIPREYAKGEEDVAFLCKALVVEEYGEYYNVVMWHDKSLHPLVSEINRVHHFDETRHLAFGRARLVETFNEKSKNWSSDELQGFRDWLAAYLKSSWGDYYNPTMYKDAGLEDGYNLRQMALEHGRAHREKASEVLVNLLVENQILEHAPEL
ncbi:MAG: diiron oxygenase [Pseudomonadaceae bacterium]|nr:diiron oxygenase [Pseudomonadaceae bacterium]